MRCFCDQSSKNMGEGRAESQTVYTVLCAPSETQCSESTAWLELGSDGHGLLD